MDNLPFFPTAASTSAGQVDLLMAVLIGLSSFFTILVFFLVFYFGIKYRRGKRADRSNPPTTSLKIELGWMFGLLFLGLGTYTAATLLYFKMAQQPENALEVYVIGRQWMWKMQQPQGQREINELHIPAGQPVRLILTSQDVIHSFYVPAFRVKYDAIPGRYTNLSFEASKVGEYHIFCAEYCGTEHSRMIGTVYVMEPRDYQAWLSGGGGSAGQGQPVAQEGEQLYQQLGCSSCHSNSATAPSLEGLFGQPVSLEGGETVTADETYIRESIHFPERKIVAGYQPIMPSYEGRVSEEQIIALIAYIKSIGGSAQGSSNAGSPNPTGATPPVATPAP